MTNKVLPGILDSISRGYTIASSALFDRFTDTPNPGRLNRTFGTPTSQHVFTISMWIKRGVGSTVNGTSNTYAGAAYDIMDCGGGTQNNQLWMYDNLNMYGNGLYFSTTNVFRDLSAWYHIVVACNSGLSGTNKMKIYVNGSEVTSFSTDNRADFPGTGDWNSNRVHSIGGGSPVVNYFDGYIAESYFIDGQALAPSSFGETSNITGTWVPKKYSGTYGNNGYYLNFSNPSSLGTDTSGRGNNFTVVGNVTGTTDVPYPSPISTTVGNYAVWDTATPHYADAYKGNTRVSCTTGSALPTTMFVNSGKWYWEVKWVSGTNPRIGFCNIAGAGQDLGGTANTWSRLNSPSRIYTNGSTSSFGTDPSVGDTIMLAMDVDAGKLWYGKNGSWEGSGNPATGANPAHTFTAGSYMSPAVASGSGTPLFEAKFGSTGFTYTAPTAFKPLNTSNLPEPSIRKAPAYFKATAYTGNGTSKVISGLNFAPNLVMLRSRAGGSTGVHDTVRSSGGSIPVIYTNQEAAQSAGGSYLTSFNSDGYTINNNTSGNANATNFMGWAWKEDAIAGMDIVTYTGNGASVQTVAHNLSATPKFILVKPTSFIDAWFVWHTGMSAGTSARFNTTTPGNEFSSAFGGTLATSSNFYVGGAGSNYTSASGQTYVAYLWTDIPGYSKFGTYTGTGSSNGPFVNLGFKPAWLLIKNISSNEQWAVMDSERPTPGNNNTGNFIPLQSTGSEDTNASYHQVDKLGNGFKIRGNSQELINLSGNTYIYAAFAESPFKYSLGK
jgi:hypothetical protein